MTAACTHVRGDGLDQWGILLHAPPGRQAVLLTIPDEMLLNGLGSEEPIQARHGFDSISTRVIWIVSSIDIAMYADQLDVGPPPHQRPIAMPLEAAWQRAAARRTHRALARIALSKRLRGSIPLSETIVAQAF